MKTNFDRYLEEQLMNPAFAARFELAGAAWDARLSFPRCAELSETRNDKMHLKIKQQ